MPECWGSRFTARIKGDGYDVQVCTDEPLTDEERAALHALLQALVSASSEGSV